MCFCHIKVNFALKSGRSKSFKNVKILCFLQRIIVFDLIIFSSKLKQSWVSEDIVTLPWVSVLIATKSITFDQKVTTFDRFWWSKKTRKNVKCCVFLNKWLISNTYTFGSAADLSREIAVVWIHKSETQKQVKNHQKVQNKPTCSLKKAAKWSENPRFFFWERIREILVAEGINPFTPFFTKNHLFY